LLLWKLEIRDVTHRFGKRCFLETSGFTDGLVHMARGFALILEAAFLNVFLSSDLGPADSLSALNHSDHGDSQVGKDL
jgi:hypothetical protein